MLVNDTICVTLNHAIGWAELSCKRASPFQHVVRDSCCHVFYLQQWQTKCPQSFRFRNSISVQCLWDLKPACVCSPSCTSGGSTVMQKSLWYARGPGTESIYTTLHAFSLFSLNCYELEVDNAATHLIALLIFAIINRPLYYGQWKWAVVTGCMPPFL